MNKYLFKRLTLNSHKKLFSKSGPIPHHDPALPKMMKKNRIHIFGDQHLFIGGDSTKEYFVNLKHMYAKNLFGAIMLALKYVVGGVIVPTFIIVYLRNVSQDQANYYVKEFSPYVGQMSYPNNLKDKIQLIRKLSSTNSDFLERRDVHYYHTSFWGTERLDLETPFEEHVRTNSNVIGKKIG